MHLKARKFHAVHTVGVVLISRARVLRKHLRKGLALFTGHLFPKARGLLYRKVMPAGGVVRLKSDSPFLYAYTRAMVELNRQQVLVDTADLYHSGMVDPILNIRTH